MISIEVAEISSPIGRLQVAARDGRVCGILFDDDRTSLDALLERRFGRVECRPAADPGGAIRRLAAYFAGELRALDDIAVDPGGTPFQQAIWTELRRVPPGV